MKFILSFIKILIIATLLSKSNIVYANEYKKNLTELINTEIKHWSHSDTIIDAINNQNERHINLSISDMKILDNNWRAERRKIKKPLSDRVLNNELSNYLRQIQKDSEGVYTELIIVDKKGINVGQSIMSVNYWQGQQEIWKKTFGSRSYATYITDLHFNDNTELFQVGVSFMITYEEEPIGIVYAGIDVEQLEEWKKRQEE